MPSHYGLDIASIFAQAQQIKANRERTRLMALQQEQLARQMALESQLPEARHQFYMGNQSALQQIAPDEAAQLSQARAQTDLLRERQRVQRAGAAQTESETQRARTLHTARVVANAGKMALQNPEAYPHIMAGLMRQAEQGTVDLDATGIRKQLETNAPMPPREQLEQMVAGAEATLGAFGDRRKFTTLQENAAGALGYQSAEEAWQADAPAMKQMMGRLMIEEPKTRAQAAAPRTTIQMPGAEQRQPLTKPMVTRLQGDLIANQKMLSHLQSVSSLANPKYFSLWGRIKNKGAKLTAQVNPEWLPKAAEGDLEARRKLNNEVEQLFNEYRKHITGAAASVKELQMLRDTMFNMSLSWPEFKASLEQFQEKLTRSMRLQRKVLREGANLTPEQAEARMDQLYMAGADARTLTDMEAREAELRALGMGEADALAALVGEGYLTREQGEKALELLKQ
jgi:hypothetical protein